MKIPAAIVVAVLVWSSARYLPPYFLELRKLDLEESKVEVQNAKQLAMLRVLRANSAALAEKTQGHPESSPNDRFY
ncbi:MAG: hypothetical protein EOP84_36905 [Verrucomicrobiaceae bacterium]|nr:MAG: hypothetical protein EOP84_36905 [Verrucomicrobiaceae bacterium]